MSPHFHDNIIVFLMITTVKITKAQAAVVIDMNYVRTSNSNCKPPDGAEIESLTSESVLRCGALCSSDFACWSCAFSRTERRCLKYNRILSEEDCMDIGNWTTFTQRNPCLNGGALNASGSCLCFNGYLGLRCERLMEDCMEAKLSGHYPNLGSAAHDQRVLWARPRLSSRDFQVRCWPDGKTVFFRRASFDTTNFNRPWQEYVAGFGSAKADHWLGLQNLYVLTKSGNYCLHLYFTFRAAVQGKLKANVYYGHFRLTDTTLFTASLGPRATSPVNFDLLGDINGTPFSTPGRDNDAVSSRSCAEEYSGGWWFAQCPDYNLLGETTNGQPLNGTQYLYYGPARPEDIYVVTGSVYGPCV